MTCGTRHLERTREPHSFRHSQDQHDRDRSQPKDDHDYLLDIGPGYCLDPPSDA